MEYIHSIFYRKINPSDFKKMYDIDRPATGGGQTYLEAAGIDTDELVQFLSLGEISDSPLENETRHIYTIYAYVLGQNGDATKLEFAPRGGRINYRISRQTIRHKHPAWRTENGFPEPNRGIDGQYTSEGNFQGIIDNLVIIIVRTSYNKYYASFINTDTIPDTWPKNVGLERIFEGERRGILNLIEYNIPFINNKENPFGIPETTPDKVRKTGGCNIILYGVPGSGKSYTVSKEYCDDEERIERLVFHPDYTYSDFVGQILPNVSEGIVSYEFTEGPFTRLLKKAYQNPGAEYYLIIEEINRGNAPAIFGDVFQLLDRDAEGNSEYGISNADIARRVYVDESKLVRIPSNMYIIGTMNTSDQNVFTLDTAFQRRWIMRMIENDMDKVDPNFANHKILDTDITWKQFNTVINDIILKKNLHMTSSEDKRLGVFFVHERDLEYNFAEDDISLPMEERIKASHDNSRFPEKVLKYLWDDAFKFSRDTVFETNLYFSLEDIVRKFKSSKGNERFTIFKEEIYNAFLSPENATNE